MSKNLIQEIKIIKKKEITKPKFEDNLGYVPSDVIPKKNKRKNRLKFFIFFFGILIFLGGICYWYSFLFTFARVEIKEKVEKLSLNEEIFTAQKNITSEIPFEIVIVSDEIEKKVIFTESMEASTYARGEVVLFNEFSSNPQNLLTKTRIIDNNNLIYFTDNAVKIPGYTKSKDGKIIPGSVSVGITAQNPGEKYNGNPRDFSILGFKGTVKYEKFYARSKGEIIGGVSGLVYSIGPMQLGEINSQAESSFKTTMIRKIETQIPKDYILYPDAINFSFKLGNIENSKTTEGEVKIEGTLSAIIFKKNDLIKAIVRKKLSNVLDKDIKEIEIPQIQFLKFSFVNQNQIINKDTKEFKFLLTGVDNFIWHPNINLLKEDLRGVEKTEVQKIIKNYSGIDTVNLKIIPPWMKNIPKNLARIKVDIK